MASKTALFGDDSDDDSDASDDDPKTQPAVWDNVGATAEEAGGGKKVTKGGMDADADADAGAVTTPVKPDNKGALFGDDDSSEDDEFDGVDDGIVGRSSSGGGGSGIVARQTSEGGADGGRSMNQRLGLDSDSDDEKGRDAGDGDDGTGTATTAKEPAYAPPRRMELTNLPGLHDRGGSMDDDGGRARPTHFITKLPNLVAINSAAYDASSHDMEREERQYRGYVHNMIRWRYKTDGAGEIVRDEGGEPRRESNTRVVKWSDGSYTLHVGKEVLEVDNVDGGVPADHPDSSMAGFPGINGYLYVSQKARIRPPSRKALERGGPPTEGEEDEEEDDDDDDAPCQPAGTVLECVAPIVSRLVPRPSSLASEAHRNQALAVRQRNVKRARIAEIVTEVDPEKEKLARIKGKDDLAKSRARGGGGGGGGGGRRSGGGGGGRRRGMNAGYLEDDDDYDGVNIGRLKKNTMRRDRSDGEEEMDYGDDDDSEEDDEGWMSKKKKTRGAAAARAAGAKAPTKSHKSYSESSDEGEVVFGDDDDDDDDDGAAFVKKRGGGGSGTKKTVFSDDDDD